METTDSRCVSDQSQVSSIGNPRMKWFTFHCTRMKWYNFC